MPPALSPGGGRWASLFAFIGGRSAARAADPLTIEADGATIAAKCINFGSRLGQLLTLYDPDYVIGIQAETLYQRSHKNFAWYKGGEHTNTELDPGKTGTKMMSLLDGNLVISRSNTDTTAGTKVFLELYQEDPEGKIKDVYPSIRFYHPGQFWHQLEARGDGIHLKNGAISTDIYRALIVSDLTAKGKLVISRSNADTTAGTKVFFELYQEDSEGKIKDVYPSIRFYHPGKFWHRLEARGDGLHIKNGDISTDTYTALTVGDLTAKGVKATTLQLINQNTDAHGSTPWGGDFTITGISDDDKTVKLAPTPH
jgi:hypothetical protein